MPNVPSLNRRDLAIALGRKSTLKLGYKLRMHVVADALHLRYDDNLFAILALTEGRQERVAIFATGWDSQKVADLLNQVVVDAGLTERVISYDAGTCLVIGANLRFIGEVVWVGGRMATINGHPVRAEATL